MIADQLLDRIFVDNAFVGVVIDIKPDNKLVICYEGVIILDPDSTDKDGDRIFVREDNMARIPDDAIDATWGRRVDLSQEEWKQMVRGEGCGGACECQS